MIPGASYLPSPSQLSKETIAVLFASLAAAYIISQFPAVQRFINANSVTVNVKPQLPA